MKNFITLSFTLYLLLFPTYKVVGQTFMPGETYYDKTGFVEYRAGNLPIILSAPHGGNWMPDTIPDRNCEGCSYAIDSYTRVITWGVYEAFYEITGCYPHMIMNRLHRIKFDANRDIDDAADGNALVEEAWRSYHDYIGLAKTKVDDDYGKGLFLDIHGHAHTIQRIELGYLLSRDALSLPPSILNSEDISNQSSIRSLVKNNLSGATHTQLLQGEFSLGSLLDNQGLASVPSLTDPFPQESEPYFTGGYNTQRHGSSNNASTIDAIQIELNQDVRFDEDNRMRLIDSLTYAISDYIDLHYDDRFIGNYCNLISSIESQPHNASTNLFFPNPASDYISINLNDTDTELLIFNALGQRILSQRLTANKKVDISHIEKGYYTIIILKDNQIINVGKLVKS